MWPVLFAYDPFTSLQARGVKGQSDHCLQIQVCHCVCLSKLCWGVLLIWIVEGQGPTALVVGADGGCLDIFSLIYHFSFLSPSLWEAALYRLKYCLKGLLSPKQPTNSVYGEWVHFQEKQLCHFHVSPLFALQVLEPKIGEIANSTDLYEVAHNEPPHLDLHCLPSSL